MKLQIVWWRERPAIKWWHYPNILPDKYRPFFYGLYLGIIEIRFWPKRPENIQ